MQTELANRLHYKINVSYNGTSFDGFQSQPSKNAVQDHIEKALKIYFREDIRIRGASRTDQGVHAQGQIAKFSATKEVPYDRLLRSLNALLPRDISIEKIIQCPPEFDPIYHAKGKIYRYRLWKGYCYHTFVKPFVWSVQDKISIPLLTETMLSFVGEHDFTSYCNSDSSTKTKTRKIYEIEVDDRGDLIDIWVCGKGFLKQMIRILVGTAVDVGMGKIAITDLPKILEAKDRTQAGETAPASGLSLVQIFYDRVKTIEEIKEEQRSGFCFSIRT